MTAIAHRPLADRFLDWAARRPNASAFAGAALVGFSLWTAMHPAPAFAGCAAPTIASVEAISPAVLV